MQLQHAMCSMQCAACNVQHAMCSMQCAAHTVERSMAHAPHGYPQGRCTPRPPLHRQVRLRLCRLTVRWIGSDTVAAAISSAACALRRRAHDLFAACGVGVVGQNGQPEALPAMVHGQVYERSRLGGSADRLASHGYPCVPLRIGTRPADGSFTATFGALNPTRPSRGGSEGPAWYRCVQLCTNARWLVRAA
jgi:hypothetical protein